MSVQLNFTNLVPTWVVFLYPHVSHEGGIETMSEYLETREDKTVSPKSLCDLASTVLKGNYFELSNIIYHQKLGTAIGTKFACQPFYGRSRESFI